MPCANKVEGKKYVICRPCAKGNHTGEPCREYNRGPIWHLDRSCFECGFDSAAH